MKMFSILAAIVSIAGSASAQTLQWTGPQINKTAHGVSDWNYLGSAGAGTLIQYVHILNPNIPEEKTAFDGTPQGFKRFFLRYEYSKDQEGNFGRHYKSFFALAEADCVNRKVRLARIFIYAENNLSGNLVAQDVWDWTTPAPGTLGDRQIRGVCD